MTSTIQTTTDFIFPETKIIYKKGICLSDLTAAMGIECSAGQLTQMGRTMAKRYRELYNREPYKREQSINGFTCFVNAYDQADRAMMESVIQEHCLESPQKRSRL